MFSFVVVGLVFLAAGRGGRGGFWIGFGTGLTFVNRDTANRRLPSFWKSTSFRRWAERGVRSEGDVRKNNCIRKMECIL